MVPLIIGRTVHSWLKSAELKPNADRASCLLSAREVSFAGALRSRLATLVKLPVVVAMPYKTKLLPVTLIVFLALLKAIVAPTRNFVDVD